MLKSKILSTAMAALAVFAMAAAKPASADLILSDSTVITFDAGYDGSTEGEYVGTTSTPPIFDTDAYVGATSASAVYAPLQLNAYTDEHSYFEHYVFGSFYVGSDISGTNIFTAGNGDELYGTFTASEEMFDPFNTPYGLLGIQTFTGGTGLFAGATGSTSILYLFAEENTVVLFGDFQPVPEPSQVAVFAMACVGLGVLVIRKRKTRTA